MKRALGTVVLVGVLLGTGCGENAATQPPATMLPVGGGGGPNTVTPPPPAANGAYNELVAAGPMVSDQRSSAMPALNGGAIADGPYVLTRYEWYAPNMLHMRTIALEVTGGGKFAQYLWQRDQEPEQRGTVTIGTNADRIALRGVCPAGLDLEWDRFGTGGDGALTLYSTRDSKAAFFVRR